MTGEAVGKQFVHVHQEIAPRLLETVYEVLLVHALWSGGLRIDRLDHAHKKQLLTFLPSAGKRFGYWLNFSQVLMKRGMTRTVNRLPAGND